MGRAQIAAAAVALVQGLNGLTMIAAPKAWYASTPGVADSGPYNFHFIVDVGLAYVVAAAALAIGALRASRSLALAGAAWPVGHSGVHLVAWCEHGLPAGLALWSELIGVLSVSLLGLGAALSIADRKGPL